MHRPVAVNESPSDIPDGMLVAAALAGDRQQCSQLARRYQHELLRVARSRLGRLDWAEEVVQETFLATFKSLHTYDSRYSFRTWIWTILLNQCRQYLKKRSRGRLVRSWSDQPADAGQECVVEALQCGAAPPDYLLAAERSELLDRMLRELPDAQADALRLRFFGGLKYREIADAMGCSLSSAKNRVRWGLMKMAEPLRAETESSRSRPSESCDEKPDHMR
jgi:RNA polymerase sigma-70 factor (ECF subfamily)